MVNTSMHGARVKADILRTGRDLWREHGPEKVSARGIGRALGLTHAGVLYHFDNSADRMKSEIAADAVAAGDVGVVRQLIVINHAAVAHLDATARTAYLAGA